MAFVAAVVAVLYGALHLAGARSIPDDVPDWARAAWVALCAVTLVAAIALLVSQSIAVVALLAIGVLGVAALAVANGTWIHGRPTLSHHAVRGVFALVVLALAIAA